MFDVMVCSLAHGDEVVTHAALCVIFETFANQTSMKFSIGFFFFCELVILHYDL